MEASLPLMSCMNNTTTMTVSANIYFLDSDSLDNGNGNTIDNNTSTYNDMNRNNSIFLAM